MKTMKARSAHILIFAGVAVSLASAVGFYQRRLDQRRILETPSEPTKEMHSDTIVEDITFSILPERVDGDYSIDRSGGVSHASGEEAYPGGTYFIDGGPKSEFKPLKK